MRVGDAPASAPDGGQRRAKISNEVVALYRRRYGKGPERARTYVEPGIVVCELGQSMLTIEKTLCAEGEADHVRDLRAAFHRMARSEFVAAVEDAAGVSVRSFMASVDPVEDLVVLVFLLDEG